jgi:sugar-specific transcriptional regulator TrmB/DNA-binding CsgD family transcriptional regulator
VNQAIGTPLELLGLTPAEMRLYETLVGATPTLPVDLVAASGLTPSQVARAATSLLGRGMIHRSAGRPGRYTAVAPEVAVGALIRHREQQLDASRDEMSRLAGVYHSLHRYTRPAELVEVIEGRDNVTGLYRRLVEAASTTMRYFNRPPYFSDASDDGIQEARRISEGIEFRVVYDSSAFATPAQLATARGNHGHGERARVADSLPMAMMIADDRQALIPVSQHAGAIDAAYLLHPSTLLAALAALFETTWKHAPPLFLPPRHQPPHDSTTDATDSDLLLLLSAGLSDYAIARHLGCSPRTLQRRISALYTQLGSTTRFQAGVMARDKGWIGQASAPTKGVRPPGGASPIPPDD